MSEPAWIAEARKYIGLREISGDQDHPEIVRMWKDIKRGGIKDDETAWCSAFCGAMLERVGIESSRFESARSYLSWGVVIPEPVYGCVVVFSRAGGGHVGFVVGQTGGGDLLVLGGNQGNEVNIKAFPRARAVGYRIPEGVELARAELQIGSATPSTSEA